MKNLLSTVGVSLVAIAISVLGFVFCPPILSSLQIETLIILSIICSVSVLYCFVVGEISGNNSQMDKLWSILPEVYLWVIAIRSGLNPRVLMMAIIATLWGIRLTFNFGRKGAYRLKFWEGEEDYRWAYLRENTILKNRILFFFFDLFFISIYQNVLILATCLPGVAVMESSVPFGGMDFVASCLMVFFLALETISDEQQWKFQSTKYKLLGEGKTLSELPEPYSLGFNTKGVWAFMRHPNYLGEQGVWVSLYLFTVQAGVNTYGIFNWSIVGCMFLILLFLGSSTFGESITSGKYPQYKDYQSKVFKYLPFRKY